MNCNKDILHLQYFIEIILKYSSVTYRELHSQLLDCYDGMQTVLAKMSKKEDCLAYAETYRRKAFAKLREQDEQRPLNPDMMPFLIEQMNKEVTEFNSTVIYYSVLETLLLIWVIKPGFGIVRFYSTKWVNKEMPLEVIH